MCKICKYWDARLFRNKFWKSLKLQNWRPFPKESFVLWTCAFKWVSKRDTETERDLIQAQIANTTREKEQKWIGWGPWCKLKQIILSYLSNFLSQHLTSESISIFLVLDGGRCSRKQSQSRCNVIGLSWSHRARRGLRLIFLLWLKNCFSL